MVHENGQAVGADSGTADSTSGQGLTPAQEGDVAQLVGQGMSLAQAIIIALSGGTQPGATGSGPPPVIGAFEQRVTFDWAKSWPLLALGGIGLLLVLRR